MNLYLYASALLLLAAMPCVTNASDAEIVKRLERLVELRAEEAELQHELAKEGKHDEGVAEIALCRARIELARELGQEADVMAQLQHILKIHRARFQRAKDMVAANQASRQVMRKMEIEVLQTEIEILREQAAEPR